MKCQTPSNPIKVWGQKPSYVEANGKKKSPGQEITHHYCLFTQYYGLCWAMIRGVDLLSRITAIQAAERLNKYSLLNEFWKVGVFNLPLCVLASFQECNLKITINYLLQKDTRDHKVSWDVYLTNEEKPSEIK